MSARSGSYVGGCARVLTLFQSSQGVPKELLFAICELAIVDITSQGKQPDLLPLHDIK